MTQTNETQNLREVLGALANWYAKNEEDKKDDNKWTGCCYEKDLDDFIGKYNA